MIVHITRNIAQTCIKLEYASGKAFNCADVTVEIHKRGREKSCGCNGMCGSTDYYNPCKPCAEPEPPRVSSCGCEDLGPTIPLYAYKALSIDNDGRICFAWDNALYSLPNGRYIAKVMRDGVCLTYFEIELDCDVVDIVATENEAGFNDCKGC